MNAIVCRSHPTTRLILLLGHTTHKNALFLFKSFGDNDLNAVVRRSHMTTRLVHQNDRLSLSFIVGGI